MKIKIIAVILLCSVISSGIVPGMTVFTNHKNIVSSTFDDFDMVIISPEKFTKAVQPLVNHKNTYGIKTYVKTTESIYQEYIGRDKAEQIKYFIKDAIETNQIKYVLLLGGRQGQGLNYYIPGRYVHLDDGYLDKTYLSDLYFADIYKRNSTEFEDWDSNRNDVFAEWRIDQLDLYPDVYVGRLPCRYQFEVADIVHKIIAYETGKNMTWFHRLIVVGGDTNPGIGDPFPFEGEEICDTICNLLPMFTITKLYGSNGMLTGSSELINGINQGCGFLVFEGHGLQNALVTYNSDQLMLEVFHNKYIRQLRNTNMYPVAMFGCCVTGKFDVGFLNVFNKSPLNLGKYGFSDCIPEELAWRLVREKNAGSIATIAATSIVWGNVGDADQNNIPDIVEKGLIGWMNVEFFKQYQTEGKQILGQAFGDSISKYISMFPVQWDKFDCKTVQELILIGDPSLKIGGYPS